MGHSLSAPLPVPLQPSPHQCSSTLPHTRVRALGNHNTPHTANTQQQPPHAPTHSRRTVLSKAQTSNNNNKNSTQQAQAMAAVCFDTPLNLSPNHATSMGQTASPETSPQASVPTTVGFLYDSSSNRTFRIPDVPATSTILNVKQWYNKHGAPQGDSRQLAVMHNNIPVEDYTQVWQLAQGQGQFAVVVSPVSSPRSSLNLYVDTPLQPGAPISLRLSSDSTILYAKQRLLELLDLPMSTASPPATTLMHHASPEALLNDHTL